MFFKLYFFDSMIIKTIISRYWPKTWLPDLISSCSCSAAMADCSVAHAAQQWLTSSVATVVLFLNMWFEMLINGKNENNLQGVWDSRLIPLPESHFKFARSGCVIVVRQRLLSIKRLWVRITSTAGRRRSYIELELKINVYVLRWLGVINNCAGSWVERDSRCARQTHILTINTRALHMLNPHSTTFVIIPGLGIYDVYHVYVIIISEYFCISRCFRSFLSTNQFYWWIIKFS